MMMKHILVPYDGSEQAEKAFDVALEFAAKFKSKITVLSVARIPEPPEDEETEAIVEAAEKQYEELFKKLQAKATASLSLKLNFEIKGGHPAEQIIYVAEEKEVDHIVMGHRGNTYFKRWLLGSVAKQVMIYAHCAITIVR
ncbi:universal stress protein [Legionella sp. PATHC035]|uniref:universal stress protein n=1 Tax=Legionella sp. PATHC035 TaxID=2992040 RepID=UPI002244499A|nr:universal stress protein [Legionella sp. PATHC035]MCW8410507.1 universal stress protein [Legionella sp. PATHC035]